MGQPVGLAGCTLLFRRQQCVDADARPAGVSTDINSSPTYDKYDSARTVMMMVAIADRALIVTLNAEHLGYRTQIFSAFRSGK